MLLELLVAFFRRFLIIDHRFMILLRVLPSIIHFLCRAYLIRSLLPSILISLFSKPLIHLIVRGVYPEDYLIDYSIILQQRLIPWVSYYPFVIVEPFSTPRGTYFSTFQAQPYLNPITREVYQSLFTYHWLSIHWYWN